MGAREPVRVGVVGAGRFGRLHAITLAGLAEAELVGIVDQNVEALAWAEHELRGVPAWTDLATALAQSGAEAWVVATSTASHVRAAAQVLASGGSVLIEKPLAPDVRAAEQLAPFVADGSRNVMLGHILLFAPEVRRLVREVRERGPIVHMSLVRHRPAVTPALYPGETPFRLLMVHDLYLAQALTDGVDPVRLSAQTSTCTDGTIELALAQIEWSGGAIGSLTASFLAPPGMAADGFDRIEVFGSGWAARLALNPQPFEVYTDRVEWPLALDIHIERAAPSGWLAEELRAFCRVVRGAADVPIGARFADGMQVLRWLEQLECAAAQRGGGAG